MQHAKSAGMHKLILHDGAGATARVTRATIGLDRPVLAPNEARTLWEHTTQCLRVQPLDFYPPIALDESVELGAAATRSHLMKLI